MFSQNSMTIVGRLGKDAEVKTFDNGNVIVTFCVATQEYLGKDSDTGKAKYDETEWTDVKCMGMIGKTMSELMPKKGEQVCVIGRKKTESWEDRSGNTQRRVWLYAKNCGLITQPQEEGQ